MGDWSGNFDAPSQTLQGVDGCDIRTTLEKQSD
jgi:hypothetical protein